MNIQLNRQGQLSLRQQLALIIRLRILDGEIPHGRKLASIRSMAKRLRIHHNTVAAAYRELERMGNLTNKKGVGFFVRGAPPRQGHIQTLQDMLAAALHTASDVGLAPSEVRRALETWLACRPPYDRVLVVDPFKETAELLAKEIEKTSSVPLVAMTRDELKAASAAQLEGALLVTLSSYLHEVRQIFPGAPVVAINLQYPIREIAGVPDGSRILVVLHPPRILRYAAAVFETLCNDTISYTALPLSSRAEWQAQVRAADVVFADCIAAPALQQRRPRRIVEIRIIAQASLNELRMKLAFAWPNSSPTFRFTDSLRHVTGTVAHVSETA